MTTRTVYCRLLEIKGPQWEKIDSQITQCLTRTISNMELIGRSPELRGFVGTRRIGTAVGGFFTVQYEKDEIHYDKTKSYEIKHHELFDRVFFAFFPKAKKVLLQHRQLADSPLNMQTINRLFTLALAEVFRRCNKVGPVISLDEEETVIPTAQFVDQFRKSTRVSRVVVFSPNPEEIPEGFDYYNPQRQRNEIIRGSHIHDYRQLEQLDLQAREDGDIKDLHMRDLMEVSTIVQMEYFLEGEEHKRELKRKMPTRFSFSIRMDAPELSEEELQRVIDSLDRVGALQISARSEPEGSDQLSLFDHWPQG